MNNAQLNERGQVTIPKKIREQADIGPNDPVTIKVNDQGQIIIAKRDFFDDLNDLIRRDLVSEGVAPYEIEVKMIERKKTLATSLNKMVSEAEKELERGDCVSYDELKRELEES